MKKQKNLKVLVLSLAMAVGMLLPMTTNAQSDGFFRNDNYQNRDVSINDEGGISNWGIGETVPLGSGLMVLAAAGAGYAILRRRRNRNNSARHIAMLFFAVLMLFGMTNCKKKIVETTNTTPTSGVHITLNVDGDNNGSKVIVDPTNGGQNNFASVNYEDGDIIYVGYHNNYVGYLTYVEDPVVGNHFTGSVDISSSDGYSPLHFYFLGGTGIQPDPSEVSDNELSVVISDQTSKYPAISYAHSDQPYTGGGAYSATLLNKCSIMKFKVVTTSNSQNCIMGMNNMVTVDFTNPGGSDNGFSYSKDGFGEIKMHSHTGGSGTSESPYEVWAIVLPQVALEEGARGSVYNEDELGILPAIPAIESNKYYSDDVAVINMDLTKWDGDLAKLRNGDLEPYTYRWYDCEKYACRQCECESFHC